MLDRSEAIAGLEAEGFLVTEWRDEAHASYAEHFHPHREVRIVLEGTMTIRTPQGRRVLFPGDRIDLAANELHEAVVGPTGVHYLAGTLR